MSTRTLMLWLVLAIVPDLSEPYLTPRRVRRLVLWAAVLVALVALSPDLHSQPVYWHNEDFTAGLDTTGLGA